MNINGKCPICGEDLIQSKEPISKKCEICGKDFVSNYACSNNHSICNVCLSKPFLAEAKKICALTKSENPVEIAELIMDSPKFSLVGCSHYIVTLMALLTAYRNCGGKIFEIDEIIKVINPRTELCPTSMCKLGGFCGIPLSLGITFVNLLNLTDKNETLEAELATELTRNCMNQVMSKHNSGSLDCCKRGTYLSIIYASKFISSNLWVDMKIPTMLKCKYFEGNPRCNKDRCALYNGWKTDRPQKAD